MPNPAHESTRDRSGHGVVHRCHLRLSSVARGPSRREVTIGHLLATCRTAHGIGGKVNPPLRDQDDVDALWEYVLDGTVRLGGERPRLLPRREEVRLAARGRVRGEVRLRRHRVLAGRPGVGGPAARPATGSGRGADLEEPGAAVRPTRASSCPPASPTRSSAAAACWRTARSPASRRGSTCRAPPHRAGTGLRGRNR